MTTHTPAHPIELALLAALVVAEALLTLAVMVVALVLTLAGWQPQQQAQPAPPEPQPKPQPCPDPWLPPCWPELEALPVTQLRRLARAAGLPRSISRTGRRAELLPALAGAAMAW